ncbi:Magnesium transport protein CorA [Madurella mycetomatis]|uniref:Magnesium transport protein CorA n=1 Tax=Madurella mycetomatis TaxID=100816 RepID=A0A175VXM6_9PEZI|nr:Magnesium transport protein CorA [Madurella mycetomatis]
MAFRSIGDIDPNSTPAKDKLTSTEAKDIPQSTSAMPIDYLSLLSAVDLSKRAKNDPFHALIPIFAHAAFSEVALLNLMTELIEDLMDPLRPDDFRDDCFEKLQHYEAVMQKQVNQLRHCVRAISVLAKRQVSSGRVYPRQASRRGEQGSSSSEHQDVESPAPQSTEHRLVSSFSASGVLEDYEDLLERSLQLLTRIAVAMNIEMNRAMVLESRRAMEQSERTKKLTILATYFIPLTFTAALFGMNFEILGQGTLQPWCGQMAGVEFGEDFTVEKENPVVTLFQF